MASGVYSRQSLVTGNNTVLVSNTAVAAGKNGVVTVNFVNTSGNTVNIRLALASNTTPQANEWVEYDTALNPNGVLERTGIVVSPGIGVVAVASASGITAVAYGFES